MHMSLRVAPILLAGMMQGAPPSAPYDALRPRVVVTTDPELDDANSLIRYLLFSTDFRTEGLIYASSQFHWKGDGTGKTLSVPNREYSRWGLNLCPCASWRWAPNERFIDLAVETYERVYPNLRVHNPNYPTPAALKSKIRWGNVEFDGDISKDSPGSDLIKALLLDDEPGPLYLLAWGGQSTIARALKSIHDQYAGTPEWPSIYEKVSRKAILSTSGDQDDTYAKYIHPTWPDIRTLPAGVGGVPLGYEAQAMVSVADSVYYSTAWTRENISSVGPFGALYRVWGDGKQMVQGDIFDYFGLSGLTAEQLKAKGYVVWTPPRPQGEFLGEGDTFTYLNLIDNGLGGYEDATPGGWAGHGARETPAATGQRPLPQITINSYDDLLRLQEQASARPRPPSPDPDFILAAQNALAARMRWSVTANYAAANHAPVVSLEGSSHISARPGETVRLRGKVSDPDKNAVTVRWWRWKDVDTYPGQVMLPTPTALRTTLQVPKDAKPGQTIQLVLEATDNGTPALTQYERVVVTVAGSRQSIGLFDAESDVGHVSHAGSTSYDARRQEYVISGSGQNMWADRDDFHFVWTRLSGNFTLFTRARFIGTGVEEHRKIGWTIRPTLTSNGVHVTAALHGNGLMSLQYRRSVGGQTDEQKSRDSLPDGDVLIRLERRNGMYLMSVGKFGDSLVTQELTDVTLPDTVYVGLFVCSHNDSVVERARFTNVRIDH